MPTKPREREKTLIRYFLSSYEHNSWANCHLDWLDEKKDGAVEVLATRPDGKTLALEHTLIEIFVGEKEDYVHFKRFLLIEDDASMAVPDRIIYVDMPKGALPKGYSWDTIVTAVHEWLKAKILTFPEGRSRHICPINELEGNVLITLALQVRVVLSPGFQGGILIRRYGETDIGGAVEKAMAAKLPKLVRTEADKRILFLERDQFSLSESSILDEIEGRRQKFPDLEQVNEVWFAETVFFDTGNYVGFSLFEDHQLVQTLDFLEGRLHSRSEYGKPYGDSNVPTDGLT